MNPPVKGQLSRVLLAVLLPFVACLVQWIMWDTFKPFVWFLFYPTIFFSSRIGGLQGGLLATAISALMVLYVFMPPQFSFVIDNPKQLYSVVVFLVMGVLFSLTHEGLRKAQERIQRLYEQTRQLDELKSQLFANVSHELRTPLTLILGPVTRQLARKDLPEDERRDLQVVERNARLLYRHVSDLLDVAKVEAKKMAMHYSREDLGRVVRFVTSHFELLAAEKRIRFTVEAADGLLAQVDTEKFQRILFNLLSNAFKFTPDGGTISVSMRTDRSYVIFEVKDNGPGIPVNMRTAIFERFRQVEGGTVRRHGGTGLGLAIAREFVLLHQGTIEVTEPPEGGSLFVVKLPLSTSAGGEIHSHGVSLDEQIERQLLEELRPQVQREAPLKPASGNHAPLILVVEDNLDMSAFLVQTLENKYRVATAFNGQEGLDKALSVLPDLILSDVMMPGMSGDQMVMALRARTETAHTPVVILTAKADDELRVKLLEHHVQDYLCKPFSAAELLARVGGIMAERHRTNEELRNSDTMLRGILEAVNESVFLIEPDGKILFHNSTAAQRLGKSSDELLGRCTFDFLPPELAQSRREHVARVLETGRAVQFEDVRGEIYFEHTVYPVCDSQGKVRRLAIFGRAVTAQKLAVNALQKSEMLLKDTQDITKVGGWEYDVSTGRVSWTDQVYQIYGVKKDFDPHDVTKAMSMYEPESLLKLRSAFDHAVKQGEPYDLELKLIRANGETIWVRTLGKSILEENKVVRVMGNIMDITDRKRMEDEQQRLYEQARQDVRIRSELLDEVNHRVKNNLVSILGVIEMEKQESAQSGRSTVSLLNGLKGRIGGMLAVHELLNKSYWAPLKLGELVERILEGAIRGSEISDRIGIELDFYPKDRRAERIIPQQATAVGLILNELATNSIKYAFVGRSYGRIKIDMIFLVVDNAAPEILTLIYRDDGHGWPADVLAGTREGVGLRLMRGTLRSLPQGKMVLQNEGGAMATISFKLTPII